MEWVGCDEMRKDEMRWCENGWDERQEDWIY